MAEKRKKLAASIVDYLRDSGTTYTEEQQESIDVAVQCISDVFHLEGETTAGKVNLASLFDVYLKTQEKLAQSKSSGGGPATGATGTTRASESSSTTSVPLPPSTSGNVPNPEVTRDAKAAEALKKEGNTLMAQKDYQGAIDAYTKAIAADDSNVVYYSNRAAAYSQCSQFDKAIEDAQTALQLDPAYSKAYSRLGHAYFSSGQYEAAVEAYEKGLELDPGNGIMKTSLATARTKLPAESSSDSIRGTGAESVTSGGAGGGGAGGGGGFDIGSILGNPQFMAMAQNFMQSGAMDGIMNNPQYAEMAQRFMGGAGGGAGGGGMPDLAAMMNDPSLRAMASSLMGGRGAGAGAGAGAGSGAGAGAGTG